MKPTALIALILQGPLAHGQFALETIGGPRSEHLLSASIATDLNQDGNQDLVYVYAGANGEILVAQLSSAKGELDSPIHRDGLLDIATAVRWVPSSKVSEVVWFKNLGNLRFETRTLASIDENYFRGSRPAISTMTASLIWVWRPSTLSLAFTQSFSIMVGRVFARNSETPAPRIQHLPVLRLESGGEGLYPTSIGLAHQRWFPPHSLQSHESKDSANALKRIGVYLDGCSTA